MSQIDFINSFNPHFYFEKISLTAVVLSDRWQLSSTCITPFLKSDNKINVRNYCPIYNPYYCSKLFGNFVIKRILD